MPNWDHWQDRLVALGAQWPEGKLKRIMRAVYHRICSPLYALDGIIKKADLLQDGTLLVGLNNGIVFYLPQDKKEELQHFQHVNFNKLTNIQAAFEPFTSGFLMLHEQYVQTVYERYYRLNEGVVIVDAGANIGAFSVKAAKVIGDEGKVVAIEPEAGNLAFLRRNIEANDLRNAVIVPKALWSEKGKLNLCLSATSLCHSFYRDSSYGMKEIDGLQEVQVDTLDNILKTLSIDHIDLLKMDIEGAELEAIKGMTETLRVTRNLAIETCHVVNGKKTSPIVAQFLRDEGFKVRAISDYVYAWKEMSAK